ncbi:ESCRT-II complex, vps25 subunit [Exidia glandulosa HHB12029]|uniref:ESCRT-II complex, vps25 subunit n=1 Tax=Exidia glandulosa HHB12029 TaxID=1314781 RepID=A0A165N0Y7_EXIGL|nr:ESCRT-II complex, vps25 subunit [Exidia glandulosa HHB12029]
MALRRRTLPSGFTLPSIHSLHPFFTHQTVPTTLAVQTEHWTRLILSYARHARLFTLGVEDADLKTGPWADILYNPEIARSVKPAHLESLIATLVAQGKAYYDPPKQTRTVLLLWRTLDEWAEVLFTWASDTGQLNTILTFYEIQEPELKSELSGIPTPLLRRAIQALIKSSRAQLIDGTEGGGVRIFASTR